jgi:Uma2 family endonuclease
MTQTATTRQFTPEEYLRLEMAAEIKHEYHAGEILAMSGGTYAHSRITMNAGRSIGNRLEGSPCFALDSNMRVWLAKQGRYVYPDVSIVCGQPQFDPSDVNLTTITNPKLIVEVLSPSTEAYDRGAKFSAYRDLESMVEYVLISQDQPSIETFVRRPEGHWLFAAWQGVEAVAKLQSLQIDIPLSEVYSGIDFAPLLPTL